MTNDLYSAVEVNFFNDSMYTSRPRKISWSFFLGCFCALVCWVLFRPGLFSVDSLTIYEQAVTGNFKDFHPTILPLVIRIFLSAGGDIGSIALVACLLGFLGVRRLSLAVSRLFSVPEERREITACLVILILWFPLTPMAIYFVTLWTDSWLAICLLWVISFLLELWMDVGEIQPIRLSFLILLMSVAMLLRSNGIVLFLPMATVLLIILRDRAIPGVGAILLALCPLVIFLVYVRLQYQVLRIQPVRPERVVYALDLGSMLVYDPTICQTISLQSCDIVQKDFSSGFVVGDGAIDHTLNQGLSRVDAGFSHLFQQPYLSGDLWLAAQKFPHTYVTVKVLNFWDYIRPRNQYYYQSFIHPNELGLMLNPQFAGARRVIFIALHRVYSHPLYKYFSFVHLPWIAINLLGVVYFSIIRQGSGRYRVIRWVLLIPAIYALSHLLALPASDFRFMYPSLLIMQVMTLTWVLIFSRRIRSRSFV